MSGSFPGGPIKLSSPATREFWEVPVLYEDEHLLALSKPAGLLASPEAGEPGRVSLMSLLHAAVAEGKPWVCQRPGLAYLVNAHRLEGDASGVILLAKSKAALVELANHFGSEKPCQEYLALVQGIPRRGQFEVNAKLGADPARPGLVRVDARGGKRTRTRFELVEQFGGWVLLRCVPLTGRVHQVRAHLRHAGFPVAGDPLYGGQALLLSRLKPGYRLKPRRQERPLFGRAALHLERICVPHPVNGNPLSIAAPWPRDFQVAVKYLRRYAGGGEASGLS